MTGTRIHAIIQGCHPVDKAGWAMLTAAIGTAWSPALGTPTRITRSREFDEVALLSFAWLVPRPFRDGIRPHSHDLHGSLPRCRAAGRFPGCVSEHRPGDCLVHPKQCLKAETQNVPVGFAPLHLRSVVAFHGARYLRSMRGPGLGIGPQAVRASLDNHHQPVEGVPMSATVNSAPSSTCGPTWIPPSSPPWCWLTCRKNI
jgi:hypothetical protein